MAHRPNRRDFIGTAALAAGALAVGCVDQPPATADPDAALRGPLDGEPPDADAADVGPDAAPDAAPEADAASEPDAAPDAAPEPDADLDADLDAAADAAPEPDAAPDAMAEPDAAPDAAPDAGPPPFDPAVELAELDVFPLGVSAGDALPDRVVIQTRHTGNTPLALWIWPAAGEPDALRIAEYPARRAAGGFVHVDAAELRPATRYHFCFVERAEPPAPPVGRSPVGTVRTASAADSLDTVVFAACACTSNGNAFDALDDAADRDDLDLFVLLGDTTYADGAVTRDDYRRKWAENLGTAPYRRLRASTGLLATWDDHEVDNNWNPETFDPAVRAAATGAFFEHLPLRRDPMAPDRIWKSLRWGRTAEFFVLDCRGERRPSTRLGPDAEYISAAQFDWLLAGLRASEAVFKIVCTSVPVGDFPYPSGEDRWAGYPAQRDALLQAIELDGIEGVVFISGDFHHASAGRLTAQGPGSTVPEFLCGPGGQLPNPGYLLLPGLPHFDWSTGINNYAVFTLDPRGRQLHVQWISALGRSLHEALIAV